MSDLDLTRRISQVLLTALALSLWTTPSHAGDERKVVAMPTSYPWYTAVKVVILKADGEHHAGGSGMLIAPCTVLTNGHVVYDVSSASFRTIVGVHPGRYFDNATGHTIDPFGGRAPVGLGTNTKYAAGKGAKYDYGAIFLGTSFNAEGVTTFIPLSFDYKPTYVNMAGYPTEDLPSSATGSTKEQWRAFGTVDDIQPRLLGTGATSTGGASGAGVWVRWKGSDERRMVAVNRAHSTQHEGIHVRLIKANEDVITGWQQEQCRDGSSAPRMSLDHLLTRRRTLQGEAIPLLSTAALRLAPAPAVPVGPPLARVSQVIENTFYHWEEYAVGSSVPEDGMEEASAGSTGAEGRPPERYLRLLAPQHRLLSTAEAQVLLSASALWQRGPRRPTRPTRTTAAPETFSVYPATSEPLPPQDPAAEASSDAPLRHVIRR